VSWVYGEGLLEGGGGLLELGGEQQRAGELVVLLGCEDLGKAGGQLGVRLGHFGDFENLGLACLIKINLDVSYFLGL
jgi:hypothetical protein